ncbi:hypothetical protein EVAR_14318_1 [Eumeta japonica]|uniref:Uncharacterized protein n=1 Tax=Eumeta variegata TaxID=151549 RepID=A0A4C1UN36_EUMVA|nr:hypothetical protein EVAR_14318_1 [Eumeta japonica]
MLIAGAKFNRQIQGMGITFRVQGWVTLYRGCQEPGLRGAKTRYSNARPDRSTPPRRCTIVLSHKVFLETLHLGSLFATAADVDTVANQLVNKISRAQSMAITLLLISTSRRGDLPSHIKVRLQQKLKLHKLWACTRCPKLKKQLTISPERYPWQSDFRGAAWEATIDQADESSKNLNRLCRQLTRTSTPLCPIVNRDLFLSSAELHKFMLRLPKKKVPRPDAISTAALRHLPRRTMITWKRDKVITIPKAGKDPCTSENL